MSGIVSQTFISVKPLYAGFGHHILSCKVCQAHLLHKKISQNQGEIVDNRNLILRNQYQILRNQDIMVCYFFLCPQPCGLLQQHIQLSGLHPHGQLFTIGIVVHILSPPQFLRALGKGHY